ncbi:hypothetical protein Tco_1457709 [Tanacetum coccineum]
MMNEIDLRIDSVEATEADKEERIRLLQELNDIDHFESMDLRQKGSFKMGCRRRREFKILSRNDQTKKKVSSNSRSHDKFQTQVHQIPRSSHSSFKAIDSTINSVSEKLINNEEIRRAVWDCGSDKSLGPDGFSFHFLKTVLDVLKADEELFVMNFFTS